MASAPSGNTPVRGRIDRAGHLVEADAPLLRLQEEAGSALGRPLALPQVAAVARSAQKLGIPLSRTVLAASATQDLDLWVRAVPDADGVSLSIEGWQARPAAGPRLTVVAGGRDDAEEGSAPAAHTLDTDAELRVVDCSPALAQRLGAATPTGQPLTRLFQLLDNGDGAMPLLVALGARQDFSDQKARVRREDGGDALLSGEVRTDGEGRFAGFHLTVAIEGEEADADNPFRDPALDEALRSPLDQIIAAADRIVERSDGPLRSDYAAYASDIAAAGRHLLSVIRSISDDQSPSAEPVDLVTISREAAALVQRDDDHVVEIDDHEGPVTARGEARGVLQILVNLIGNAVRHSPADGTVAVVFDESDGRVSVTVADQGPGIATRDQQRIFDKYEQGAKPGSAGLGLSISRRLARAMGGDILLDSAPGEGARFTLSLPRA